MFACLFFGDSLALGSGTAVNALPMRSCEVRAAEGAASVTMLRWTPGRRHYDTAILSVGSNDDVGTATSRQRAGAVARIPRALASSSQLGRCLNTGAAAQGMIDAMGACFKQDHDRADARLNATYRATMARLLIARQSALGTSQRAWITERDRACPENNGPGAGQLAPMNHLGCLTKQTDRRTAWLKRFRCCAAYGETIISLTDRHASLENRRGEPGCCLRSPGLVRRKAGFPPSNRPAGG